MKNVLITLFLFLSVLLICFTSVNYLNNTSNTLYLENAQIEKHIKEDNWQQANNISKQMDKKWHDFSSRCSIFVNHTLIDDLSLEDHKLSAYIKTKDKEEALASCNSIGFLIERIKKLETVNFQNLF